MFALQLRGRLSAIGAHWALFSGPLGFRRAVGICCSYISFDSDIDLSPLFQPHMVAIFIRQSIFDAAFLI